MVHFGPWSTTLAAGMAFGTLVASMLALSRSNAAANRLLAAMMLVIVLKLGPYVLGFAGYFDAYPWLSFVPLSFGLALGPLIYLHVVRLTSSAMPPRWGLHLLPALLQFAYYAIMFAQPMAVKDAWATRVDSPWIDPIETGLELASLLIYLLLALRRYRRYQAWLDATLSNREQFRIEWLRNVLFAMLAMLAIATVYELASAMLHFDYFQRIPLYLMLIVLITYLGLEGWRHADVVYPLPADPDIEASPGNVQGRDWMAQGQRWRDDLQASGWWRDPDLSLERLARHLGTNTSYLSRAFNEGLGLSFNAVVNALRVQAVQAELQRGDRSTDLLTLAQSVGFNSKTSFNRLFKAHTGLTPSQFRDAAARDGVMPGAGANP